MTHSSLGPNQLDFCRRWSAFRDLEAITERVRKETEESRKAHPVRTARLDRIAARKEAA